MSLVHVLRPHSLLCPSEDTLTDVSLRNDSNLNFSVSERPREQQRFVSPDRNGCPEYALHGIPLLRLPQVRWNLRAEHSASSPKSETSV